MSFKQLATLKPLYIIKESLVLCLISWRSIIQSVLSVLFLMVMMSLVLVFFPKILALMVSLVVILVFLVSITWLSIVEQLYVRHFKQQVISWKAGFSRCRQPVYHFTAAILFIDGCAYFAGFFNPLLGYIAFSTVAMTSILVVSGQPIVKAMASTLKLSWQNFFTQLVVFLPLPLAIWLPVWLARVFDTWGTLGHGLVIMFNIAICVWIAIIIVWYFALCICLQKHLAPETIADDLLDLKNKTLINQGDNND